MIKVFEAKLPSFTNLRPFIEEIDKSRVYSNNGPLSFLLEQRIARLVGLPSENIAVCANGTLGLQGLIATSEISTEELISPSWTFVATPLAIRGANKKIVFADIDTETWALDEKYIGEGSLYVLPFGYPINLEKITKSINPKKQSLIIDAAASLANYKFFDFESKHRFAAMLSLHATKLIGAGEGGVVISNDPLWIRKFKSWTNFGFEGTRESRSLGQNAKMSEYTAAVALASLDLWPDHAIKYESLTQICSKITLEVGYACQPSMSEGFISPYWIVKLNSKASKLKLIERLNESHIEWRDWWSYGCHKMKAFRNSERIGQLKNTTELASRTIGLPFHLNLKPNELRLVASMLEDL